MKNIKFKTIPSRFFFLSFLMIVHISCTKKTKKMGETNDNKNIEILKIGNSMYSQAEFERSCKALEKSGFSADSSIKRTLNTCFINSVLLNHLNYIKYTLSDSDKKELAYLNRNTLIQLAKDSILKAINIDSNDIQAEIDRYKNKQIVIDLIWLPEKSNKLIDECYSSLNKGENIIDMLYSGKEYYKKIISEDGMIKRVNVKPGIFCDKITDFIIKGAEAETKIIDTEDGHYVIKIVHKKEDYPTNWDYYETELNLKLLELKKSALQKNRVRISDINMAVVDSADFSVNALDPKSGFVAKYGEIFISLDEIKTQISTLPFNQKLFFSNKSCLPSALATLILIKHNKKPINSNDLMNELLIDKKENKKPLYSDFFEYQLLVFYESSVLYPWLFPSLFEDFEKVSINYDLIYNNKLVNQKSYDLADTLAYANKSSCLTVQDFINELKQVSQFSIREVLQIENTRKLIFYYFKSTQNISSQEVTIKNDLLENVILGYSENLIFADFAIGILSTSFGDVATRTPYLHNINIVNSKNLRLNIGELKSIINIYPKNIQHAFRADKTNFNRFWRINALQEIIEQELWIQKANKLNLQNSKKYRQLAEKNEQKMRVRTFLNSNKNEYNFYTDSSFISDITMTTQNLKASCDSLYFKEYFKYIIELKKAFNIEQ